MKVFITGASGGIGRVLCTQFRDAGWTVYAGCLEGETPHGAIRVPLDVTDDSSVAEARALVGVPDVLINNAGLGLLGPIAELPDEAWTRQFEVNVRGLLRVTRAFAPDLCRRGQGRIINVGSLAGVVTLPWFGAYAASKYAVEALTDALRLELGPFGVRVSLIEPSIVGTGFVDHAVRSLQRAAPGSLWQGPLEESLALTSRLAAVQLAPEQVAEAVLHAATARWPRARYRVGRLASWLLRIAALLPTPVVDAALRTLGGLREKTRPLPRVAEERGS